MKPRIKGRYFNGRIQWTSKFDPLWRGSVFSAIEFASAGPKGEK